MGIEKPDRGQDSAEPTPVDTSQFITRAEANANSSGVSEQLSRIILLLSQISDAPIPEPEPLSGPVPAFDIIANQLQTILEE